MTLGEELLQDQLDRAESDKRDLTNMLALARQALRDAQDVITRLAGGCLDLDADEDEPERIAADAVVAINTALEKVGACRTAHNASNEGRILRLSRSINLLGTGPER